MSERKRIYKPGGTYFITSATHRRKSYFTSKKPARLVVNQFYHYEDEIGFQIVAFTVQPDHYHLLLTTTQNANISQIIHRINSYSSTALNNHLNNESKEKIWQGKPWTELIRNEDMFWQKVAYILLNPWRAGLVENPLEEYHSSNLDEWKETKGKDFLLDLFSQFGRGFE
ncbi:transposase [Candidatus Bipolaricaulota bacterium]|nr:transposase [Candidatus Bipolaricaulota bacterium]